MGGMGRLKSYVWRYWRRYFFGLLCLLGTVTVVMWIPRWLREAVRIIEQGGSLSDVTGYALTIVAAGVIQGIIRTLSRSLIFNAGRDIEYDLRNDLFAHLQKLPVSYYHSQRTGDLMSRVINDISAVRALLGPGILNLFNTPVYFFYAVILMFSLDIRLTLMALLPSPLLIWAVRQFRGRIMKSSLAVQRQMADLSSHIQENLSGMHVVKAYTQEETQIHRFVKLNEEYQEKNMVLAQLRGLIGPCMQGFNGLSVMAVLGYGGLRVIRGELLVADIVAFIAYLNVLAWPTAAFGWMLSLVERGRAAMERLEEIFKAEPEIASPAHPAAPIESEVAVEFRHVWFAHDAKANGHAVLKDINFTLPKGRTLAIVGRTGAGKSTLAQLLPRLYDATAGEILIGGREIRSLSLSELRRGIGYVPQDPFLFSASLSRNLSFGRDGISEQEILAANRLTRLDRDVDIFPEGLGTVVGERGITLSGGQKQRATLARALLTDAPMIVLDDCLSSVDAQTEDEILKGLRSVVREKTCVIISHRISAVKDADEILVLDEGRIIERGTHAELVQQGGLYSELHHQQQLSDELEQI